MPTDEQKQYIENFTEKRDTLSLEVGLLTQEKETLLFANSELSTLNASLKQEIENMRLNSSRIGFEESEKVAKLREETSSLEKEISSLKVIKEALSKDIEEKNSTILNLGLTIKAIQTTTQDTVETIRNMSQDLKVFSSSASDTTVKIGNEANRIKRFTDELANVIDKERKTNHDRTREIDAREIAVINREKMVEMQYAQRIKDLNK